MWRRIETRADRSRTGVRPALIGRRPALFIVLCATSTLLLLGCEREKRRYQDSPSSPPVTGVPASDLRPGGRGSADLNGPYQSNAWAVSEGQRNYRWFNCSGCHFNGGGGIGPALMDQEWIYGSEPAQIFATIVEGRPNGMPSFRGKLTDQQVWQLVAYVRSLSGQLRKDISPGRSDHMDARPAPQSTPPEKPKNSGV